MEKTLLELIKKYLPKIWSIIGSNGQKVSKKISEYIIRVRDLPPDYSADKPHCVFDWIIFAEEGNNRAVSFLNFIDRQCFELFNIVDIEFKPKIKNTITEMLLAMDKDISIPNNPAYQNFLAEIVGLLFLLTEADYYLKDIEGSLSNGKTTDFVFKNIKTSDVICIEMVSFNSIQASKIKSNELLIKLIEDKINAKVDSKTKNLQLAGDQLTIRDENVTFVVLPIIWAEISDLLPFKSAFDSLEKDRVNALQCCSLNVKEMKDGSFSYTFCTVNNILEDWKDQLCNVKNESL